MAVPVPANELSPLDQIRFVETEMTRNIAAARAAAVQTVQDAHARAAHLKKQAHELGLHKGQVQYSEMIASAAQEAQTIVAAAHLQAKTLQQNGQSRMEGAVREIVNVVVGMKSTGEMK